VHSGRLGLRVILMASVPLLVVGLTAGAAQASGAGKVTSYTASSVSGPGEIAAGPDGALWFTNFFSNSIGRITTNGKITNYTDPTIDCPQGITAGPDGNLWFTNDCNNSIGKITPAGAVTKYTSTTISDPGFITAGPDGNQQQALPLLFAGLRHSRHEILSCRIAEEIGQRLGDHQTHCPGFAGPQRSGHRIRSRIPQSFGRLENPLT